jgi:regulator of RNase E activity RraA
MSTTKLWKSDDELFALVERELFTCVVGDVMDKMDLQHQFLPPQIQALRQDMVVIGRAMPVLAVDVFAEKIAGSANSLMNKSFGLMLEALDDLRHNEVYVNTGSSPRNAVWGELMSTRARKLGSRGAVVEWLCPRYESDSEDELPDLWFRFLWAGFGSHAIKLWISESPLRLDRCEFVLEIFLFGDVDGVLLVPAEAEAEVFTRALEKARGEKLVRKGD